MNTDYLHGYSPAEQRRLHAQARIFEPLIHRDIHYPPTGHILELGCGAGAQTAILLRRNPRLRITAVDRSQDQLDAAETYFRRHSARRQLSFVRADGTALPFARNTFDGALYIWLLEHVPDPLPLLRETRRVLKPGAAVFFREVFNHSVYVHPRCPAFETYWTAYNTHQASIGGHPNIGPRVATLLRTAGFRNIVATPEIISFDARAPRMRRRWLAYWLDLVLSGAPALLAAGGLAPSVIPVMKREFAALYRNPAAIFHFTPIFGSATK